MDLRVVEDISIQPLSVAKAPTGWAVEIPKGYEGQIRIRSSASQQNLIIPNSPGTIDSDYRGEVIILLRNMSLDRIVIPAGRRIAQLIIAPVALAHVQVVDDLSTTERADGGFGSTGQD
jgi:dUTP pyrophosphatase